MRDISGSMRLFVTASLLLGAFFLLSTVTHGEATVPRQPLRDMPYALGGWMGKDAPLQQDVVQSVGVSDYANRFYFQQGNAPVQVYVGYYASQKTGDRIHSPKNCLPGSGWDPIQSGYAAIPISDGKRIVVNEYVIQKDQEKALVFYWYQGRGRVLASEYSGTFWMMVDAISRNRTDGALVRVVTLMNDGEAKAHSRLIEFTQDLFPNLDSLIPK